MDGKRVLYDIETNDEKKIRKEETWLIDFNYN